MVVAESQELLDQRFLVDFICKGMTTLNVETIKRVVVRGKSTGNQISAWREAFDLHSPSLTKTNQTSISTSSKTLATSATSKPKLELKFFNQALNFLQNRHVERGVLVIGTFIVTSIIWAGIGTFNSVSKQAKNETQTNDIAQSVSSPNNTPSPNEIAQSVSSPNNTHSLTGILVINKWINGVEGQLCSGENGYRDIESGRQILVKNNKGEILATGELGLGQLVKTPVHESFQDIANDSGFGTPLTCQFPIDIENVPKADFYTFEIGRRGGITYTAKQLQQQGWKIELSLG